MPRQTIDNATAINSTYSNRPLYGGANYTPTQQPTPVRIATESPVQNLLDKGQEAQRESAQLLSEAYITRYERTLDLQHKSTATDISAALEADLNNRRQLVDGDPDSLFNADHTLNKTKLRELITQYSDKAATTNRGYVTQEAQERANQSRSKFTDGLRNRIGTEIGILVSQRARTAFAANYFGLIAAGRYDEAIASIPEGNASGGCAPEENLRYRNNALRAAAKAKTESMKTNDNGDKSLEQLFNALQGHGIGDTE